MNPVAARNTIDLILVRIKNLQEYPDTGTPLAGKIDVPTPYRFVRAGNYLAFYRKLENHIYIDRILYARRNYLRILFSVFDDEL